MNPKKILIVEDEESIIEIMTDALESEGYSVKSCDAIDKAIKLIDEECPHLVITDNDMPGGTGLEMLSELRRHENYVTVIFVSARTDSEFVSQVLRAGADDYVRKPFRIDELLARVETTLRHNESHRALYEANRKLQTLVDHDYLTGLYNMRIMYDKIDYELKRAKRYEREVACVMLDMDHFKSVNDENDHLFGSYVLQEMGKIISETMREVDIAARYGGDEFLIVLSEAGDEGAQKFCERLRRAVEEHDFNDGIHKIKLTTSMGYEIFDKDSSLDARELVRHADRALYKSKKLGRNRFCRY